MDQGDLEALFTIIPERSLQRRFFDLAHVYAQASDKLLDALATSKNPDFAAPMIMCQSFAIELLLKFFLTIDHPPATTVDDLRLAGVKLKSHKYSELFDQLLPSTKDKIARVCTTLSGTETDAADFRNILISQGDDPFVSWRYIYERNGITYFEKQAFNLVTDTLGKAAEAERKSERSS